MDINKKNLNTYEFWEELHSLKNQRSYIKNICFNEIHLTISHNKIDQDILNKIADLSNLQEFQKARNYWLKGINTTIMPSYMMLRDGLPNVENLKLFKDEILLMRENIKNISIKINQNKWLGCTQKPITDIVNIGIGGSDLGPRFCYEALKNLKLNDSLNFHFISDADFYNLDNCLKNLIPETTLFIISSKSFTTEETMLNAKMAFEWISHPNAFEHHFIAVTANETKAQELGYKHIIRLGEWVIGRYSSTSAINLINSIMMGYDNYLEFLQGARDMDNHFLLTDWKENLPMLMAFVGIWNINFLKIPSQLVLIYSSKLKLFCDYVQQLDMESNGKSYNLQGEIVDYETGPIVWGGLGNQAQHSYYQLLAQGSHQIAIDFLSTIDIRNNCLNDFCNKRKKSLFEGLYLPGKVNKTINQQYSVNHIRLTEISPRSIGALIALYEHKIFTQAWMWNINPFDQPGVESAKLEDRSKVFDFIDS